MAKRKFSRLFRNLNPNFKRGQLTYRTVVTRIQRKPMVSFLSALAILLLAIIASKIIFTPKVAPEKKVSPVKQVEVYQVGTAPKLSFQGKTTKAGVVKVLSQVPGVITEINVSEGEKVTKGANLLSISTNYQGANAAGVQAAIAARQYRQITDTFDTQKDLIAKQKDLANSIRDNATNLATISGQSINDTQNLINLNQDILNRLATNLTNLQNTNAGGGSDTLILQTEEAISQFQAGQNQLQSALRNLNYTTNTNNPPQRLADLQRDIALKGLDLQEKGLEANRDITKLQLTLAGINASLFHPTAPVAGAVERIFVKPFDLLSPGTPLLTLVSDNKEMQLVVPTPESAARQLSKIDTATIHLPNREEELALGFLSTEATDGRLFTITFNLPEEDYSQIADGDFVRVDLPIAGKSAAGGYFVPLDAVIQTQDQTLLYIIDQGKVTHQNVVLGPVSGQFVNISSGLTGTERVILNRNVVEGDSVKAL